MYMASYIMVAQYNKGYKAFTNETPEMEEPMYVPMEVDNENVLASMVHQAKLVNNHDNTPHPIYLAFETTFPSHLYFLFPHIAMQHKTSFTLSCTQSFFFFYPPT